MFKQDLALNNLQGLICHKNQPINQLCIHHKSKNLSLKYRYLFFKCKYLISIKKM